MKIVIEVQGGCVYKVTGDQDAENLEVIVADYDSIDQGDPPPEDLLFGDNYTSAAEIIQQGIGLW
jgi:hypothetical protein